MPNGYGLRTDEEEEFQPGILPSQRKKPGLKEPSIPSERSPMDLLAEGRSTQRLAGGYGATGIGEEGEGPSPVIPGAKGTFAGEEEPEFSTNWPQQQQAGGLKEKPEMSGFKEWVSLPYRMQKAKLEKLEQENWLRDSSERMKRGMPSLAQATASFEADDLPQAVMHLTKAYDEILDGGEMEGIIKPFDRETINIANGARVDKLIRIRQPDGNILHLPLDKDNIQQLLNKAKAAYNPQTYITSTMTRKAAIKAHNEDQSLNPTIHADSSLTRTQMDPKTGKKRSESFKDRDDYIKKTGITPHSTPTAKDEVQDAEMKKKQYMNVPGVGLVKLGGRGEEPTVVSGMEAPTKEKAPTILDPNKITKIKKGDKEVSGYYVQLADGSNKFIETPGHVEAQKGQITQQSIVKMRAEFNAAYDLKFLDEDTGKYIEGKGIDDREKQLEHHMRQVRGLKEPREDEAVRKGLIEAPPKSEKSTMRSIRQPTQKKSQKTLVEAKKNKKTGEIHKIYSDGTREIITAPGAKTTRRIKEPGVMAK